MRNLIISVVVSLSLLSVAANGAPDNELESKISTLVRQLTLEQKISLLSGASGFDTESVEALGIRSMTMSDGAHGVRSNDGDTATAFPVGIALASTWNPQLAYEEGVAIGEEAKQRDVQIMLGPNINLVRSPLAGRNFETFGEDPVLTSKIATGYINGMQSTGVAATPKHFVGNEQETERLRGSSNIDERTLHELYLVPFESVVKEAHPWALMTAYNRLNGTFMTEHGDLINNLLKHEWGFDGVVMSDWGATHSLNALNNGLDLEMPGPARVFGNDLRNAVYFHQVSDNAINEAVKRILRLAARTGHLGSVAKTNASSKLAQSALKQGEKLHRDIARKVAAEAITLLKNEHDALPLNANSIKKLAVIGPNANIAIMQGSGSSEVMTSESIAPLDAIRSSLGTGVDVKYQAAVDNEWVPRLLDERCFSPTRDRHQSGLLAQYFANAKASGSPIISQVEKYVGGMSFGGVIANRGTHQLAVKWSGFFFAPMDGEYEFSLEHLNGDKDSQVGGDGVRVSAQILVDGKVVTNDRAAQKSEYIVMASLPTKAHANSIHLKAGTVHAFSISYSAVGLPYHALRVGLRIPPGSIEDAVKMAASADAAIVFVGSSRTTESEGRDRGNIDLDYQQDELVEAVAKANPHTIVVLNNGSAVAMPWINHVSAVLDAWFPGQYGSLALADILFGKVNPSGKVPVSFPKRLQDNPAYLFFPGKRVAQYGEGIFMGYRYYDKKDIEPLFAFGHGLSYTHFEYSNLRMPKQAKVGESISVRVDVKNTGHREGSDVVQLYVGDKDCREACPVKELKSFEKVFLQSGEQKTVVFTLMPRDFSHYDIHSHNWELDDGAFEIAIGSSSRDIRQRAELVLVE